MIGIYMYIYVCKRADLKTETPRIDTNNKEK